ncbi:MAG: hypothetical protein KJO98_08155 [Rhodothermia bacterium]|nr:hypothetical protein [Rhodothermia bacterium]
MDLTSILDWLLGLGEQYGVNPIIFAAIYVGAIPFFTLSIAWLVRNIRSGRPTTLPILSAGFFFVSAYIYLLIAGKNIPAWVYALIVGLLIYGAYSSYLKVKRRTTE